MNLLKIRTFLFLTVFILILQNCSSQRSIQNGYYLSNKNIGELILYEVVDERVVIFDFSDSTRLEYNRIEKLFDPNELIRLNIENIDMSEMENIEGFWCFEQGQHQCCNKFYFNEERMISYNKSKEDSIYKRYYFFEVKHERYFDRFSLVSVNGLQEEKSILTKKSKDTLSWFSLNNNTLINNINKDFVNRNLIGKWRVKSNNLERDITDFTTSIVLNNRNQFILEKLDNKQDTLFYFIGANVNHLYYEYDDVLSYLYIVQDDENHIKLWDLNTEDRWMELERVID